MSRMRLLVLLPLLIVPPGCSVPGEPAASELLGRINSSDAARRMPPAYSGATITNIATVASGATDPNPGNNSASVSLSVQQTTPVANLAVHLSGPTAGHTYAPGEGSCALVCHGKTHSGSGGMAIRRSGPVGIKR